MDCSTPIKKSKNCEKEGDYSLLSGLSVNLSLTEDEGPKDVVEEMLEPNLDESNITEHNQTNDNDVHNTISQSSR